MSTAATLSKDTISAFTHIEQLKGNNWIPWKQRVISLLTLAGLMPYISGTLQWPGSVATVPTSSEKSAQEAWDNYDLQVQSLLQLAVSDIELVHLAGVSTGAAMWKQLCKVNEPKGTLAVLSARRCLYRTVVHEDTPIIDHISSFRQAKENLSLLGNPMSNPDFAMLLVTSLSESWDTFTSLFFGSKSISTITSSELISLIVDEDKQWREKINAYKSANVARTPNRGKRKNIVSASSPPCMNCKKPGHTHKNC